VRTAGPRGQAPKAAQRIENACQVRDRIPGSAIPGHRRKQVLVKARKQLVAGLRSADKGFDGGVRAAVPRGIIIR
jgi:hypothetical protein